MIDSCLVTESKLVKIVLKQMEVLTDNKSNVPGPALKVPNLQQFYSTQEHNVFNNFA